MLNPNVQNKLDVGSSGVEANASKQATAETKPPGEQQTNAAKPEVSVGADAAHAPLDASAPPPAEAIAPPAASLGDASPAAREPEKKAADQSALSSALPEPDVNTAQKPTTEEMNKYAKKRVEGGSDIVEGEVVNPVAPTA